MNLKLFIGLFHIMNVSKSDVHQVLKYVKSGCLVVPIIFCFSGGGPKDLF